jgi:Fe-S-cluster-containing hydrogenase component 2
MASPPPPKAGLLQWLLFGRGPGPGGDRRYHPAEEGTPGSPTQKVAVKCDMCKGIAGGPACVRACPTGAAIRVSPTQFLGAIASRQ